MRLTFSASRLPLFGLYKNFHQLSMKSSLKLRKSYIIQNKQRLLNWLFRVFLRCTTILPESNNWVIFGRWNENEENVTDLPSLWEPGIYPTPATTACQYQKQVKTAQGWGGGAYVIRSNSISDGPEIITCSVLEIFSTTDSN